MDTRRGMEEKVEKPSRERVAPIRPERRDGKKENLRNTAITGFRFEEYIKDFSSELQEKAKQRRTKEVSPQLAAENDVELSEDILEAVSGEGEGREGNSRLIHDVGYIENL